MKLRLLKPLPGVEAGTVVNEAEYMKGYVIIDTAGSSNVFMVRSLIDEGWAEEVKETKWECKMYMLSERSKEQLEATILLLTLRKSNDGFVPTDRYYSVSVLGNVGTENWTGSCANYSDLALGNAYETYEQAEKYASDWKKLFLGMKTYEG